LYLQSFALGGTGGKAASLMFAEFEAAADNTIIHACPFFMLA
jgi:hypothetical protein